MIFRFRNPLHFYLPVGWLVLSLLLMAVGSRPASAQNTRNVVLRLKSGDQISGVILSENAKQMVISNAWIKALPVPLSEIAGRETLTNTKAMASVPKPAAAKTTKKAKPSPPAKLAAAPPASQPASKPRGKWHGQVNLGLDALVSTKNQQDYFGKLKLTYTRPYVANARKFFRNTSQVSGQYQRTDGQESANRAKAKNKTDFDIGKRSYGYCSAGVGFDEVRKVDMQFQLGPGIGSHLFRNHDNALNVESGIEYEAQYRREADNLESFFLRLAQDWTWKIQRNLKLMEKYEFLPNLESLGLGQYRMDFTSTLSYGFWQNLSLDLTADENYNTEVASGVNRNEFEVRLTLGATF